MVICFPSWLAVKCASSLCTAVLWIGASWIGVSRLLAKAGPGQPVLVVLSGSCPDLVSGIARAPRPNEVLPDASSGSSGRFDPVRNCNSRTDTPRQRCVRSRPSGRRRWTCQVATSELVRVVVWHVQRLFTSESATYVCILHPLASAERQCQSGGIVKGGYPFYVYIPL